MRIDLKLFLSSIFCLVILQNNAKCQVIVSTEGGLIEKNYPFTFLLKSAALEKQFYIDSKEFNQLLSKRKESFRNLGFENNITEYINVFKWSEVEISQMKQIFEDLWDSNLKFRNIIEIELVPSRKYRFGTGDLKDYMSKALEQDMRSINYAIDVYGAGKLPNYPKIDSVSFKTNSAEFLNLVKLIHEDLLKELNSISSYFYGSLFAAVRLLEINERWDAALLEPLAEGENRKAVEAISNVDFSKYKYSSIVVLGSGPPNYDYVISPKSMLRCRNAARNYQLGLAPFIIVTGGRVHPFKTKYIEALEMKRYLMNVLLIPESRIIIEPHARHTTTNMRNVGRLLLDYNFPTDKYSVINSHDDNLNTVLRMGKRCERELGYVPYVLGDRVNKELLEFKPTIDVYTVDWDEPLDP